ARVFGLGDAAVCSAASGAARHRPAIDEPVPYAHQELVARRGDRLSGRRLHRQHDNQPERAGAGVRVDDHDRLSRDQSRDRACEGRGHPASRPRRALGVGPNAHVELLPARAPPRSATGVSRWVRANFFGSPGNAAATILFGGLLAWALPPAFNWLVVNAVWKADYAACRALDHAGACWGFVAEKWRLILFGRYPYAEQWRPLVATAIVIAALVVTAIPAFWRRWLAWLGGGARGGFV